MKNKNFNNYNTSLVLYRFHTYKTFLLKYLWRGGGGRVDIIKAAKLRLEQYDFVT